MMEKQVDGRICQWKKGGRMEVPGCCICDFCGKQFWGRDRNDDYEIHKIQCKEDYIKQYKEKYNFVELDNRMCIKCKFFCTDETAVKGWCGGDFDGIYDWRVRMYETKADCVCDRFQPNE